MKWKKKLESKKDIKKIETPEKLERTIKLQLLPSKAHKEKLKKFLNDYRFIYNKGVEWFNQTGLYSKYDLCRYITSEKIKDCTDIIPTSPEEGWIPPIIPKEIFETPSTIRKKAISELEGAVKSAFSNLRNKNISHF